MSAALVEAVHAGLARLRDDAAYASRCGMPAPVLRLSHGTVFLRADGTVELRLREPPPVPTVFLATHILAPDDTP